MTSDVLHCGGRRSCDAAKGDSARQAGRLRGNLDLGAARDTCAPRALTRGLIIRKPLTPQGLRSSPARGARSSHDTSAAQRLSNDFHIYHHPYVVRFPFSPGATHDSKRFKGHFTNSRSSPFLLPYPIPDNIQTGRIGVYF